MLSRTFHASVAQGGKQLATQWIEYDRSWDSGSEWEVEHILRQRRNRKTVSARTQSNNRRLLILTPRCCHAEPPSLPLTPASPREPEIHRARNALFYGAHCTDTAFAALFGGFSHPAARPGHVG